MLMACNMCMPNCLRLFELIKIISWVSFYELCFDKDITNIIAFTSNKLCPSDPGVNTSQWRENAKPKETQTAFNTQSY